MPTLTEKDWEDLNRFNKQSENLSSKISHKYQILIKRLQLDNTEACNYITIEVMEDVLLKYVFKMHVGPTYYKYTIGLCHGTGKIYIILESPTLLNCKWEFTPDYPQEEMAQKIEDDVDKMVMNIK